VREKWVGLYLPLAQQSAEPLRLYTGGVISGPRTRTQAWIAWLFGKFKSSSGYMVEVPAALEALERASPEAAAWWREHAPHLVPPDKLFFFDAQAGQVVEEPMRDA
jgi:hypothetical protein